jgi:type I restriction enzyme, R subunit
LNLALCRPIFSPTEFVQIKGRGTRKHDFTNELRGEALKQSFSSKNTAKTTYKLFDFFANCEYFENEFNYDEIIALPSGKGTGEGGGEPPPPPPPGEGYIHSEQDSLTHFVASAVGEHGMKVDRMLYARFEAAVKQNTFLETLVKADDMGQAVHYVTTELFDKPNDYLNLDKLRRGIDTDRRVDLSEILQVIFGLQPRHKTADEVLFEEAAKYLQTHQIADPKAARAVVNYFKAYCTNSIVRDILDNKTYGLLNTNSIFNQNDLLALPPIDRERLPNFIKDYVPLNQFFK